ncbi:hypothetical protein ACMFMG_005327 [Clarireedia jacksonii]
MRSNRRHQRQQRKISMTKRPGTAAATTITQAVIKGITTLAQTMHTPASGGVERDLGDMLDDTTDLRHFAGTVTDIM